MKVEEILLKLKELKPELKTRFKVREVGLFGSWTRNQQKVGSDIDLLVDFNNNADLFDLIALNLFLEEIFGCPVDVIPRRALRDELKEEILHEVVIV